MIAKKYLKKDTTLLGRPRCPFPLYEFPAIFQGGIVQLSLYITFFYYLCIEIQHQGVE